MRLSPWQTNSLMFTLRYPRPDDPHYLLTQGEDAWRFTNKEHALNAYNAGLRLTQLLWEQAHPGELSSEKQRAKRDWQKSIKDAEDELLRVIYSPPPQRTAPRQKQGRGAETP